MDDVAELRTTAIDDSLINPIRYLGLSKKALVGVWLFGAFALFMIFAFTGAFAKWGIGIVVGMHMGLAFMNGIDSEFLKIVKRYYFQAKVYDPWPHAVMKHNGRPQGFSKDSLC